MPKGSNIKTNTKEANEKPTPKTTGGKTTAKILQSVVLPLVMLERNTGQIDGLPKNPRTIKNAAFAKLKQSIIENPEMLAYRELLVFQHGNKYVIIGGNMRFEALKELGYSDAPCKVLPPNTTSDQLRAYTIKDNSGFGEWNFEDLANEWEEALINACDIEVPELDTDAAIEEEAEEDKDFDVEGETPKQSKYRDGDIFQLGRHRLICGDSTDQTVIAAIMGDKNADLIVTDPPYNVNYGDKNAELNKADGGKRIETAIENDAMTPAAFRTFLETAFTNVARAANAGAAIYIFHPSRESVNFIESMEAAHFLHKQQLIWVKNNIVLGRQDYQWQHEPILYGWKEGGNHYFVKERNHRTVIEDMPDFDSMSKAELLAFIKDIRDEEKNPTTILHCDKPQASKEHPTMKPLKLLGRLIRNSSKRDDIVLDPFGGSGSTMMAAEQLGRVCYMVEKEPRYCEVILKRYAALTGTDAVYVGNIND
jgi:DNA modification methylase